MNVIKQGAFCAVMFRNMLMTGEVFDGNPGKRVTRQNHSMGARGDNVSMGIHTVFGIGVKRPTFRIKPLRDPNCNYHCYDCASVGHCLTLHDTTYLLL